MSMDGLSCFAFEIHDAELIMFRWGKKVPKRYINFGRTFGPIRNGKIKYKNI